MPYYDEIFKHVVGKFPRELATLALNTPEVEVGARLATEQPTVRTHFSDMAFHVRLPDEEAILHIEAQTDDSIGIKLREFTYYLSILRAVKNCVFCRIKRVDSECDRDPPNEWIASRIFYRSTD